MPRLDTRIDPTPPPRALPKVSLGGSAALVVGILFLCASMLPLPSTVPRLTVVNPGVHQVHVDITGPARQGGLGLGAVESGASRVTEEVIDQGQEWIFRFSYAGVDAGELVVARSELEASGWEVTTPPAVSERLQAAGVSPSSR